MSRGVWTVSVLKAPNKNAYRNKTVTGPRSASVKLPDMIICLIVMIRSTDPYNKKVNYSGKNTMKKKVFRLSFGQNQYYEETLKHHKDTNQIDSTSRHNNC